MNANEAFKYTHKALENIVLKPILQRVYSDIESEVHKGQFCLHTAFRDDKGILEPHVIKKLVEYLTLKGGYKVDFRDGDVHEGDDGHYIIDWSDPEVSQGRSPKER